MEIMKYIIFEKKCFFIKDYFIVLSKHEKIKY